MTKLTRNTGQRARGRDTDNQLDPNLWFDEASGITYLTDGDPNTGPVHLHIIGGQGGTILINDWHNGDLSITLDTKDQPKPHLPKAPKKNNAPASRRDPLLIDLSGNGIQTVGLAAGLHFDHNGDGAAEATGWAAPGTGLLMLDRNADGLLTDGTELFGDHTPVNGGLTALNGFAALAQYDRNRDSQITPDDPIWNQLKIWRHATDEAGNVLPGDPATSGQLISLDDLGINAIHLTGTRTNTTDAQGNTQLSQASITYANAPQEAPLGGGSTQQIAEYQLAQNNTDTRQPRIAVDADIIAMPDLHGSGSLLDLHQAMQRDASGQLKTLVNTYTTTTDATTRQTAFDQLIRHWAGTDNLAPNARGPLMDARKIAVLEKVYGTTLATPTAADVIVWENTYRQLTEGWQAALMAQTHLKGLFDGTAFTLDGAGHIHIGVNDEEWRITA